MTAEVVCTDGLSRARRTALERWFREKLADEGAGLVEVRRLVGGLMNETHLVRIARSRGTVEDFVLRWAPEEGVMAPYDIAFQFNVMQALGNSSVPVPQVHWLERDREILGSDFWVVEFVPGEAPGRLLKPDEPMFEEQFQSYVEALAAIHAVDWRALGLADLIPMPDPQPGKSALASLDRFLPIVLPDRRELFLHAQEWLARNRPQSWQLHLVHGDCSLSNYMFLGNKVAAVLDWELATISDPMIDIGYYCCLIERYMRDEPVDLRLHERSRFLTAYQARTGRSYDSLPFWETMACYRNALMSEHPTYAAYATPDYRRHLTWLISR